MEPTSAGIGRDHRQDRHRRPVALPAARDPPRRHEGADHGTPELNTKAAALIAEESHIKRVLNQDKVQDAGTFSAFWNRRWWPTVTGTPSTRQEKEIHYRLHLEPNIGSVKVSRSTPRRSPASAGPSRTPSSLTRACATSSRRCTSAWPTPSAGAASPASPSSPPSRSPIQWDHLTREEVNQLLKAARNDYNRLLLHFAAKTGARAGEQIAVEWGDIDWRRKQVRFQRSRTRGETGPTKSKHHRTVPLSEALIGELRELHSEAARAGASSSSATAASPIGQLHECLWRTLKGAGCARSDGTTFGTPSQAISSAPARRSSRSRSGWATAPST